MGQPITDSDRTPAADPVDSATDAEPAGCDDTDHSAEPSRAHRIRRRLPIATMAVLLSVTTAAALLFGWKLEERNDLEHAREQAVAAARDYAVILTSIDSGHADQDFAAVRNGATGDFARMYAESAEKLKPLLVQAKSVSKGHVVAAGVQSASIDRVVVVLFVDAEIVNTSSPEPRVDRNRVTMTMDRVGGKWLAGTVDLT